jgi:hypothetical protein
MIALVDDPVVNRLPPEARDAVLACAAMLADLSDENRRIVVAVLMAAIKLGEIERFPRLH